MVFTPWVELNYNTDEKHRVGGQCHCFDIALPTPSLGCIEPQSPWQELLTLPTTLLWWAIKVDCQDPAWPSFSDGQASVTTRLACESRPFCCLINACLCNLWLHKTCFVLAQVSRKKGWKRNIIKAINLVIFRSVFPFIKPNWRVMLLSKILSQWNWI